MRRPPRRLFGQFCGLIALLFFGLWPVFVAVNYLRLTLLCDMRRYNENNYLAYCGDKQYGDFEHQAFYFNLMNSNHNLSRSSVVFFGDSELQYAFSVPNVKTFFERLHTHFFYDGVWLWRGLEVYQ